MPGADIPGHFRSSKHHPNRTAFEVVGVTAADPLVLARRLIATGSPVIVVGPGDKFPEGWQKFQPDVKHLKGFRDGVDALALVCGWKHDVIDQDNKKGGRTGSFDHLPPFKSYGSTVTPGNGNHRLVPSTGIGKISPFSTPLGFVGDYLGGRRDGTGRIVAFLPGSVRRNKYGDARYVMGDSWDVEGCAAATPEPELVAALEAAGGASISPETTDYPWGDQITQWMSNEYAEAAVAGELARLDACAAGGEMWDNVSFSVAANLIEIGNCSALDRDDLHQRFLDHAPVDAGFPESRRDAKWDSALNTCDNKGRWPKSPFDAYAEDSMQQPDPNPDLIHSGQVRMAYRLREEHRDQLRYVNQVGWHRWDGKRWTFDDIGAAKRAVLKTLSRALASAVGDDKLKADVKRCESAGGLEGVLNIAQSLEPFAVTVNDLDQDPFMLNCTNGTLDLRTGEMHDHDPAELITKVCGAAYHRGKQSELWDQFLSRVLPQDEVREFLRRYVGLALLGDIREHALAVLIGTGRNGKGVFYTAINHTLGDYAVQADPFLFMQKQAGNDSTLATMSLRGARWVTVVESEQGLKLSAVTVKRLTGGDPITGRYLYRGYITFQPSHTMALVTNFAPVVPGDDPALWARIRVVPFNVVVPEEEQIRDLPAQMEQEADAILSWAVAGWMDYQALGRLAEPAAVLNATKEYQNDNDWIAQFIDERFVVSPGRKVRTSTLWAEWNAWIRTSGAATITQTDLGKSLAARGFKTIKSNGIRMWSGLDIKPFD